METMIFLRAFFQMNVFMSGYLPGPIGAGTARLRGRM